MQITLKTLFAIVSFVAVNAAAAKVHAGLLVITVPYSLVLLSMCGFRFARPLLWGIVLTVVLVPTILLMFR